MSQTDFQVLFVGGPSVGLPRAAIALTGGTTETIVFWDSAPIPKDTSSVMNLPSALFESVVEWLRNETNPQATFFANPGVTLLTATGDVAGEGEVIRTPLAARMVTLMKTKTAKGTIKSKSKTRKAA